MSSFFHLYVSYDELLVSMVFEEPSACKMIISQEIEQKAAKLEVTVDYYLREFM